MISWLSLVFAGVLLTTVYPLDRHPSDRAIALTADYLQGTLQFEDS